MNVFFGSGIIVSDFTYARNGQNEVYVKWIMELYDGYSTAPVQCLALAGLGDIIKSRAKKGDVLGFVGKLLTRSDEVSVIKEYGVLIEKVEYFKKENIPYESLSTNEFLALFEPSNVLSRMEEYKNGKKSNKKPKEM